MLEEEKRDYITMMLLSKIFWLFRDMLLIEHMGHGAIYIVDSSKEKKTFNDHIFTKYSLLSLCFYSYGILTCKIDGFTTLKQLYVHMMFKC